MADGIQLETKAQALIQRFEKLPGAERAAVVRGLKRGLLVTEDVVRQGSGVKFRRGSGGLAGRLTSYARPHSLWGVDGAIGFRKTRGFPYELSQETGAKAKPGKAMAIPVSAIAKRASERGMGPREAFPGKALTLIKGARGAFLFETKLARSSRAQGLRTSILHYVLVKSIPARLGFKRSVIAALPMISDEVEAEWTKAVGEATHD
jgi:hypothetical protein